MITTSWTKLRPHAVQSALWRTTKRYAAVPAGRGSGKTELARRRVVRMLPLKKPWSDPLYFYALPTFGQARRVAWKPLLKLIPKEWIKDVNKSDMVIETVFGSSLYILGLDKPHRAEGVQWDGGVIDESSDQRPGVFETTFLPAFSHRNAWCWRIGVPKRSGIGAADFRRFYQKGLEGDDEIGAFSWPSEDIVDPAVIEFAKENMDELDYDEQYRANWHKVGGGIFHAFDANANVRPCKYNPNLPICVGSDFNVDPMAWVLSHRYPDRVETFAELYIRNTNTQRTLDRLHKMYPNHVGWEFYGDATGRARKTSASSSDYAQIRLDDRFKDKRVFYLKSNPPVSDRFASCNAMLRSAKGVNRWFIDPSCMNLIRDLEDRSYKSGSIEPADVGDIGHITDAVGYFIHFRYPINRIISKMTDVYTHA